MTAERVDALRALLVVVDEAIAAAEPKEIASLSREKRQVLAELDALSTGAERSSIDELISRREARLAAPPVRAPARRGGGQQRKRSG